MCKTVVCATVTSVTLPSSVILCSFTSVLSRCRLMIEISLFPQQWTSHPDTLCDHAYFLRFIPTTPQLYNPVLLVWFMAGFLICEIVLFDVPFFSPFFFFLNFTTTVMHQIFTVIQSKYPFYIHPLSTPLIRKDHDGAGPNPSWYWERDRVDPGQIISLLKDKYNNCKYFIQ